MTGAVERSRAAVTTIPTVAAAIALLEDELGATEIADGPKQEVGYCPKCGRDFEPDGTCRKCDPATA